MRIVLKISALVLIFYFAEIAMSFSDKTSERQVKPDETVSFALNIDNKDSEYESLKAVDTYISSLLNTFKIKGASVAICRNEKLVYAKGFGYANYETGEIVRPEHLFRLASVSKLITAVAIMKLIENGKLSLDDNVFGPNGILPFDKFHSYDDARVENIKIRHLLNHTAGWSNHHNDPMFSSLYIAENHNINPPADLDLIIHDVLERKLDFQPGKVYSYSNFGYGLLGEVIAVKSGMPYEDYVILNIFKPLGIHDFHLGKSYYHQKFPNEVRYYEHSDAEKTLAFDGSGELVPNSYGGNYMELLGAAGGWIASAPELVKFLVAIDPSSPKPLILKKKTLQMMTDVHEAGTGLFGWRGVDNTGTSWRTGTLSGSTSLIMRQSDGVSWVVLLNGSTSKSNAIHNKIANTMFISQKEFTGWPENNLFNENYLSAELITK